jgi:hypothetical protein
MNVNEVKAFIAATEGKIFSIKFIKRSTGELRSMVCRTGVKKHLAGGEPAYDPKSKGLIWVYDMSKAGYRSIPEEGIQEILIDGTWTKVKQD